MQPTPGIGAHHAVVRGVVEQEAAVGQTKDGGRLSKTTSSGSPIAPTSTSPATPVLQRSGN
jgi:hypothetical protein